MAVSPCLPPAVPGIEPSGTRISRDHPQCCVGVVSKNLIFQPFEQRCADALASMVFCDPEIRDKVARGQAHADKVELFFGDQCAHPTIWDAGRWRAVPCDEIWISLMDDRPYQVNDGREIVG